MNAAPSEFDTGKAEDITPVILRTHKTGAKPRGTVKMASQYTRVADDDDRRHVVTIVEACNAIMQF